MGAHVSREDFEWSYTDQPHAGRRTEMLKKYPQIKKLMGHDPMFKWHVSSYVAMQLIMLFVVRNWEWWQVLVTAYAFGGSINHSLSLAIHDISHNMAFGYARPFANRLFGMWANLPIGVPMSITFKKYHEDHHRYLAVDGMDPDLPTKLEGQLFCTPIGKAIWILFQPFFYAFRPFIVIPKVPGRLELLNLAIQLVFNAIVYYFLGTKSLVYLIAGTILAMGLHPISAHFIAEHYMFKQGFETYSYYGPFNLITFNVGYHVEHHDFPNIPSSRLGELKKIAPDYYENLPHHTSWLQVLYDFIFDPAIGPYARMKRKAAGLSN